MYSSKPPSLCCYPKDACWLLLVQFDSSHVYFYALLSLAGFGKCLSKQYWLSHMALLHLANTSLFPIPLTISLLPFVFYFPRVVRVKAHGLVTSAKSAGEALQVVFSLHWGWENGWPLRHVWICGFHSQLGNAAHTNSPSGSKSFQQLMGLWQNTASPSTLRSLQHLSWLWANSA